MANLRLVYILEFLLALIAIFVVWSEVGGQGHLDLVPWYIKLGLGTGVAFAAVNATTAALAQEKPWSGQTLKWVGILLALLVCCGMASYYAHMYLEDQGDEQPNDTAAVLRVR